MVRSLRPAVCLCDVRLPGGGGELVAAEARRSAPETRVVALSAYDDPNTIMAMLRAGAISYIVKGTAGDEVLDSVHRAIRGQASMPAVAASAVGAELRGQRDHSHDTVISLRRVLDRGLMSVVFQPIVDMRSREPIAFEALCRVNSSPYRPPDQWFADAAAHDLGLEFELRAVALALDHLDHLPDGCSLHLNASPSVAMRPELGALLRRGEPERLILEITEHAHIGDYPALNAALAPIRDAGVGALIGVALTTGGAEIIVEPFTATVGTLSASILPAGPYTLSGENQGERYYIYYFDPNFAGGAITPIATQNVADFLGKPGYYLIDSIVTPKYTGGSYGGNVYRPSSWSDTGLRSTQTPGCACDADPATFAQLTAQNTSLAGQTNSDCVWAGFAPVVVPSGGATLTVIAYLLVPAAANDSTITATIGGVPTVLLSSSTSLAQASYTCAVPAGTDLSSISIEAIAGPQLSVSGASMVSLKIFDINIQ